MTFHATTTLGRRRALRSVAFNGPCNSPNCEDSDTNEDPIRPPVDPPGTESAEAVSGQARPSIGDLLQAGPASFIAALGRLFGTHSGAPALPALA